MEMSRGVFIFESVLKKRMEPTYIVYRRAVEPGIRIKKPAASRYSPSAALVLCIEYVTPRGSHCTGTVNKTKEDQNGAGTREGRPVRGTGV